MSDKRHGKRVGYKMDCDEAEDGCIGQWEHKLRDIANPWTTNAYKGSGM